jgi:hypothetical protein
MYRVNRFNTVLVSAVLGFSVLILLRRLVNLHNIGGGEFQHADWLINYSSGIVRRGISGEIFLGLSDIFGANALLLVSITQGLLTIGVIAALYAKAWSLGMSDRVTILLLSPVLVLFWVNDTTGAYRKELLGLFAFLPLLLPARPVWVVTSLVLFTLAVFFHEANAALAAALTFAIWLRSGEQSARLPIGILWFVALLGAGFSVIYADVPDYAAMCQRLLDAGLSEQLCHGIFPFLSEGFDNNLRAVQVIVLESDDVSLPIVAFLVILLFLPCLWIAQKILISKKEWIAFLISPCLIFGLYPIATDWSRWLSMQVFVMTFLLLILAEKRKNFAEPVEKYTYTLLIAFGLGIGVDQIAPMPLGGVIFNVFQSMANILN